MADLVLAAVSPVATYVTSTITILQVLAPANQRLKFREWSVSFQGTSNTATPIDVDVLRQTTLGTMTASGQTPKVVDDDMAETPQSVYAYVASAEPVAGNILQTEAVHPQTGYTWQAPFAGELKTKGGGRMGIRLVSPAAGGTCFARFIYEE